MLCILLRALLVGALSHQIVQVHTLEELVRNTEADSKASDTKKEDREKKMKKFVKDNEKLMKEYGMLQKFDDSKKFLMTDNSHLACEETANYLVLWCLDLEMEGEMKIIFI